MVLGGCRSFRVLVLTFLETVSGRRAVSPFSTCFLSPRVLKFIFYETAFQNFQNKSPFTQRGKERALGKFCDPLVSNYEICLIIQEHRLVDFFCIFRNLSKPIRSCNRYGLQIARNGNISGVLVNSCIMRQSCKVSYTKLQLPQIVIAQPVADVKFFTSNCQYYSIHIDCN